MHASTISSSRPNNVVPTLLLSAVFFMATAVSAHAMTSVEQFASMEGQLRTASAQLAQFQAVRPTGSVLGVSTSTKVAVPIRPTCRLSTDKKVYTLGDSIKLTWESSSAVSGEFIQEVMSGKDALMLPFMKVSPNDTVKISASVLGLPSLVLQVKSSTGHTFLCSQVIAIIAKDATKTDVRIAPLQAKLIQLQQQVSKLNTQRESIMIQTAKLQAQAIATQMEIERLTGVVSLADGASVELVSYEGKAIADLSPEFAQASFLMSVSVTANDHDVFIPKVVSSKIISNQAGFLIGFKDKSGRDVSSNVRTTAVSSSASTDKSNRFMVKEGTTETFTINATFYADKKVDNSYTFSVKGLSFYLYDDISPTIQAAKLIGNLSGETGYMYKGSFGFKG